MFHKNKIIAYGLLIECLPEYKHKSYIEYFKCIIEYVYNSFCFRIIDRMGNENSDDTMFRVIEIDIPIIRNFIID